MRLAIVVGLLVALTAPAYAKYEHCEAITAIDIPSDATPGELGTTWAEDIYGLSFHYDDATQRMRNFRFRVDTSPDTAYLEVTLQHGQRHRVFFQTRPGRTAFCEVGGLLPGRYNLTVTPYDANGKAGRPAMAFGLRLGNPRLHERCNHDFDVLLALAPLMLLGLLLMIVFIRVVRDLRMPTSGEAIALHVAEDIAQLALRRAQGLLLASSAGLVASLFQHSVLVSAGIVMLAIFPLGTIVAARRVLAELRADRARAELRGTLLLVRSRHGQARVQTTRRVIARARRIAVPASVARGQ